MTHLAGLLIGLATVAAQAQTVYRCGNTYAQTPCAEAQVVDASDPRTDDQRSDSLRVTAEQRRLGDQMERERLAEQRGSRVAGPGRLSAAPVAQAVLLEQVYPLKTRHSSRKRSTKVLVAVDPTTGVRRPY